MIDRDAYTSAEERHAAWCKQIDEEHERNPDGGEEVPLF